jgi:hypothetical protein
LPAVEGGILPPGKKLRQAKRFGFTKVSSVTTPIRRAGSHGSTSAKMADATFFRQALKAGRISDTVVNNRRSPTYWHLEDARTSRLEACATKVAQASSLLVNGASSSVFQ